MNISQLHSKTNRLYATALTLGVVLAVGVSGSAQAATPQTGGPINLGLATPFGVLAAAAVTNATIPDGGKTTVVTGDVGLSPGEAAAITGFGPPSTGVIVGGTQRTDPGVDDAQNDLTTVYNVAASLTAKQSGLEELNTLNLGPGVYSGRALNLAENGTLTLTGTAESVWVFKASSTLVANSGTTIKLDGGASICNVFWQVGTSATINENSTFVGTIMANESISVGENATVEGRLLARTGAVTLIDDTITRPSGCSPDITSDAPASGTVGTPYIDDVTGTGSPAPTYTVGEGTLPPGLELSPGGGLTGTPTTPGTFTFTVIASNGHANDDSATYTITISPAEVVTPGGNTPTGTGNAGAGSGSGTSKSRSGALAATGLDPSGLFLTAGSVLLAGLLLAGAAATRRRRA
jgi:hypothetical protein